VPTEPPEDVATDESYRAPDGWADVALTFAEWDDSSASVQVNAFVGGLVEDGGTCTLTLTRGADTRTAAVPSSADAATTICPSMTVPGDQLGSGTWQARVTYSSATATGASQPVEVAVPRAGCAPGAGSGPASPSSCSPGSSWSTALPAARTYSSPPRRRSRPWN
jgi:hypothetical protein